MEIENIKNMEDSDSIIDNISLSLIRVLEITETIDSL